MSEKTYQPGLYASIDIGTVTCRLLVAEITETGALIERARDREITNLGEGVDATGRLSDAAMGRVADAMARFQETVRAWSTGERPLEPTVIATSASRDAENADEFAAILASQGLTLSVIPGEREAALSFLGATGDYAGEHVLVVDSGGGSTEVVAGVAGEAPEAARSFNIGCRRITERFLSENPDGPVDEKAMESARAWMREEMAPYFEALRADGLIPCRMIAVAGTATSAVSVRDEMAIYDRSRVQGAPVSKADLDAVYAKLAALPLAERSRVTGLDPKRAPVICAGFATLQVVMELAGVDCYTASETDILQGIILDVAQG